MGKKSTPEPPDYAAAAEQTAAGNLEMLEMQTRANRPDQFTPWGSSTWEEQGGTPGVWNPQTRRFEGGTEGGWEQTIALHPDQQAALDAQMGLTRQRSELGGDLMTRVQDEYGTAADFSGFADLEEAPDRRQYEAGEYETRGPYTEREFATQGPYSMQDIQRTVGDPGDIRNRAEEAIYGKSASRLDPRFEQRREQTEAQLRNQGLRPGDEAYDNAMANLGREETDAYQQAAFDSIMGGGTEAERQLGMEIGAGGFTNQASQQALEQELGIGGQQFAEMMGVNQAELAQELGIGQQEFQEMMQVGGREFQEMMGIGQQEFGQDMATAGFQNTLRQQQFSEEMQKRGWSLNEINAILTGQQVGMPGMPGFNQAGVVEGADYTGAARDQYSAEMDQFSADQAMMNSVLNAGASAMSFSDVRLKRNVQRIGSYNGHNIYKWNWIWGGEGSGVMAHEMPREYVARHSSGYFMVDYGRI